MIHYVLNNPKATMKLKYPKHNIKKSARQYYNDYAS